MSGPCNDRLTVYFKYFVEDHLSSTLVMKPRPSWLDGTVLKQLERFQENLPGRETGAKSLQHERLNFHLACWYHGFNHYNVA